MGIQEKIKGLREERRLSQYDMADKLGISQSTYLQIEKGKTDLTVNRLFQIAGILEVSVNTLLSDEVNEFEKELEEVKSLRNELANLEFKYKTLQESMTFITSILTVFSSSMKGQSAQLSKVMDENPLLTRLGDDILSAIANSGIDSGDKDSGK